MIFVWFDICLFFVALRISIFYLKLLWVKYFVLGGVYGGADAVLAFFVFFHILLYIENAVFDDELPV